MTVSRHNPYRAGVLVLLASLLFVAGCELLVSPQTRLERAREYVAEANHRAALIELQNALQKDPQLDDARVLLAEVALWLGDARSARVELDRVDADCTSLAPPALCARVDLALGRYTEVLDWLQGSSLEPRDRHLYAGMAYQGLGRHEEAEAAFRNSLAAESNVTAEVGIVEVTAARKRTREALELSAQVIKRYPGSALAWHAHGILLAQQGEVRRAVEAFGKARQYAPAQLDGSQQAALFAADAEVKLIALDLAGARAAIDALQQVAPGSAAAQLLSARLKMAEGDHREAAADLHRIVRTEPGLTQARFMLAVALLAEGHQEQANQQLGQLLAIDPANVEARQLLAQVRMRLKDPDGALQALVPALQANPGDSRLSAMMDELTARVGLGAGAIELLERAVAQNPENARLTLQLASAYLQDGNPQRALELLRSTDRSAWETRQEALLLEALAKSQGPAAARKEAERLLAEHPGSPTIVNLVASFYAGIGDLEASRSLLNRGLQASPEDVSLLSALARVEWRAGDRYAARRALERVLDADNSNASARLALAEIELGAGNADAATRLLEPLRDDPDAPEPRLMLARIALLRNDSSEARKLVEETLRAGPTRADLRYAVGMLYLNSGRYEQALEHFQAARELAPDMPLIRLNLGRTQLALGQTAAARESLREALELRPGWIPAEGALAFIDLQEGDGPAALQRVAALERANPRDAAVRSLAGELNYSLQNYAEAAAAFEAAFALRPSSQAAIKAYRARAAARHAEPTAPLREWLARDPNDLHVRSVLAEALLAAGEPRQAVEQYEHILVLRPEDPVTLNNLAWQLHQLGDSRALELARKAHALAPGEIAIIDTLGWILVERGELSEGLPLLRDAAARPDAPPDVGFHYAAALARSGETAQAAARLQTLLAEHEEFARRVDAQRLLERLRQRTKGEG